ncbi:MAG: ethanolamine ammonia-lyase subunit EutC [Solirubrobacteraceae bacterium]|nr:ethanolamine ammonia-lyase subunit EutC [Solirubrobacteraceae bacterium]
MRSGESGAPEPSEAFPSVPGEATSASTPSAPTTGSTTTADAWAALRKLTPARIGLARAGDALATRDQLELRLAHARARDAVHADLDVAALRETLDGTGPVLSVQSAAGDRARYLQRPDLGRTLADGEVERLPAAGGDLAFVLADGLSPVAVQTHAPGMIAAITERLPDWQLAPTVIATQARVAIGDEVGEALGARFVAVLIGERPGLSAADSLGIYLTYSPRAGRMDSERNCISNVRPPVGLSYAQAADKFVALIREADRLGLTGVAIKDEAPALGS